MKDNTCKHGDDKYTCLICNDTHLTDTRDKAAEEYLENDCYAMDGDGPHRDSFKAGWDACAKSLSSADLIAEKYRLREERDALRAENELMRAELAQFAKQSTELYPLSLYDNLRTRLKSAKSERDRWREQAEKLAAALDRVASEKEDNDAPAIYDSEIPFYMTEIAREALADFEAFRSAQSPKK